MGRTTRIAAAILLAVSVGLLIATSVMSLLSVGKPVAVTYGTQIGLSIWALVLTAYPSVGWLIVRRDPRNRIGWLFLCIGVGAGFHLAATSYSGLALHAAALPLGVEASWVGNWGWVLWIGSICTLVAPLFPDGRPVNRWVWVPIGLVGAGMFTGLVGEAIAPGPLEVDPRFTNPFGVDSPVVEKLGFGLAALPLGVLVGVISLAVRYRRGDAVRRLQLRWFILSTVIVGLGFVVVLHGPWRASSGGPLPFRILEDVVTAGWGVIAAAVGIAVLRYRLYAVDLVINRALVYGSLTLILGGVYLGTVLALQVVLRPLAGEGELAVAGSTLVAAALFRPLRRRIQSFIDRRFYRARYDARRLTEQFALRMRTGIDLEGVARELEATTRAAVHPQAASVWIRPSR